MESGGDRERRHAGLQQAADGGAQMEDVGQRPDGRRDAHRDVGGERPEAQEDVVAHDAVLAQVLLAPPESGHLKGIRGLVSAARGRACERDGAEALTLGREEQLRGGANEAGAARKQGIGRAGSEACVELGHHRRRGNARNERRVGPAGDHQLLKFAAPATLDRSGETVGIGCGRCVEHCAGIRQRSGRRAVEA